MLDRRAFLKASAGAVVASQLGGCGRESPRWDPAAVAKPARSRVAVVPAAGYGPGLKEALVDGLRLFPLELRGKRVVLKPNLVELDANGVVNTHPALVLAAVEAFRALGAREVTVAEGPGHRRDNEDLLLSSGLYAALRESGVRYVDLNHDRVRRVELRSRFTDLGSLYLPETVLDAELFVSMPKMKTHHWAGATLSMKNLFGIVPGSVYGWPKNVLHWAGIENSILDINAAVAVPRFNIVDGILGMEGDGPIRGTPRQSGVVVLGADPVAVDATCARLMTLEPWEVGYLRRAEAFLGNVAEERIEQAGESIERFRQDYTVIEQFRHLKGTSLARGA